MAQGEGHGCELYGRGAESLNSRRMLLGSAPTFDLSFSFNRVGDTFKMFRVSPPNRQTRKSISIFINAVVVFPLSRSRIGLLGQTCVETRVVALDDVNPCT